ncbi:MAG: hypothetical protein A2289_03765 [Deltaproteobacteria bacterium RIFOXYA12_FULL_58_15]|nr:MAG: hypothetical protein A2289_03765 [Deltaproteobacteria bacterium RIFOXYA12_FULL_58_15]OGR08477.1 MAG: hypothetical protein A2341_02880 [Deltaproteobacteria bacterium RIFOXYB12_FULL_58_9]
MGTKALTGDHITQAIHIVHGHKVMLDADLAKLYNVATKALNQAVKRNLTRFPEDFMFQLTSDEAQALRSQSVTLTAGQAGDGASRRGKHLKYSPYVFTEQGVAMLSSVLRVERAVQVNIEIMRAFVRLRAYLNELARYNENGSLDTSFGSSGTVTTDIGPNFDFAADVVVQTDGRIVTAGRSDKDGTFMGGAFALVRYLTDGTPDTTFGTAGIVTTTFGNGFGAAAAIAIQGDGRIIAAGISRGSDGTDQDIVLIRYETNGTLDSSFGTDGRVVTDFGTDRNGNARTVLLQSDGKIIVVGTSSLVSGTGKDFVLVRYLTNGDIDPSFGVDGMVTTDFGAGYNIADDGVLDAAGKVIAVGYTKNGDNQDIAIARYWR